MRYLVTGGAGFVGSHLVDRLLARDVRVDVLDDLSAGRRRNLARWEADSRLELHVACVSEASVVDRLVARADVVLHFAAVVGVPRVLAAPLRAMRVNAWGSEVVLDAAVRHDKPVMLASSSEVYGDGQGRELPFSETDPVVLGPTCGVRGSYGCSKALMEWAAEARRREHGLRALTVRLFNVAGPRQRASQGMVLARLCAQACAGLPLTVYGDGRQTRCFAHVEDVVEALLALGDTPSAWGSTFNVGSDREVSILELADRVLVLSGSTAGIVHVPHAEAHPVDARDVRRRIPSLRKLRSVVRSGPGRSLDTLVADSLAAPAAVPARATGV